MGPQSRATPRSMPGGSGTALRAAGWIVQRPWAAGAFLFLLSAAIRASLLPLASFDPAWTIRWETGAVADQLARAGEYANPYSLATGPTAHTVPFYTLVMALLFRWFGVTPAAEYARCCLTIVSFSAMYALLPWIAARLGLGTSAGLLGGILGVLNPLHLAFGLTGVLGEEFAAIGLGLLMAATMARMARGSGSPAWSFWLGAGWGAAFHASPPLLLVWLGLTAFELSWSRQRGKWLRAGAMTVGVALACAPWVWRNYAVFHEFVFIRSNFGLELRMGNHAGAAADMEAMDRLDLRLQAHPRLHPEEAAKVKQWGEMEYMRQARREALEWIGENPRAFWRLTTLRALYFWFGSPRPPFAEAATALLTILAFLGARRVLPALNIPQRAAFLMPLATFPLVYYVVAYMPRYRLPIDWILLILAGAEVSRWISRHQPEV